MKVIGVRKRIDRLGRICIPKDMRELFVLNENVELIVTEDGILIRNPEVCQAQASEKDLSLR